MGNGFEVGTKVRVKDNYYKEYMRGKIGVIVPNKSRSCDIEVDFGKMLGGTHYGTQHNGKAHYRWFASDGRELEIVKDDSEVKYKPGDVVTVRNDLTWGIDYRMADGTNVMRATEQMESKRGAKVKIKSITKSGKYMIEGSIFPWVDEMFEEPKKSEEVGEAEYLICFVNFKKGGKLYAYKAEDFTITVDEKVIVPIGYKNAEQVARVKRIGWYTSKDVDVDIATLKTVIRKYHMDKKEEIVTFDDVVYAGNGILVTNKKGVIGIAVDTNVTK